MTQTRDDLSRRLLFILHRGFTEIRNLALARGDDQIADLADAMEILPRLVDEHTEEDIELIRFVLKNYKDRHPESRYDYLPFLDEYDVPERY